MRLIDLDPQWIDRPHANRRGIGFSFRCPCSQKHEHRVTYFFANPLDGGACARAEGWQRIGDAFETLTVSPSLGTEPHGHWTLSNGTLTGVTG